VNDTERMRRWRANPENRERERARERKRLSVPEARARKNAQTRAWMREKRRASERAQCL
jgi:hypothetical protein